MGLTQAGPTPSQFPARRLGLGPREEPADDSESTVGAARLSRRPAAGLSAAPGPVGRCRSQTESETRPAC